MTTVGVLALQGDFQKHIDMLESLGACPLEVRRPEDLMACEALIMPGGESTSLLRQMRFIGLDRAIPAFAQEKPLFGTCAGLILMAKNIQGDSMQSLGLLDIEVERNAFGRQNDSFRAVVSVELGGCLGVHKSHALFIRAPCIRVCGPGVKILARYGGEPILVQEGHLLGATFHPELTDDEAIHRYFLELIEF